MFLRSVLLIVVALLFSLIFVFDEASILEEPALLSPRISSPSKNEVTEDVGAVSPKQVMRIVESSECKSFIVTGANKICLPQTVSVDGRENLNPSAKIALHERTSFVSITTLQNPLKDLNQNIPVLVQGLDDAEPVKTEFSGGAVNQDFSPFFSKLCRWPCR